jgi:hypothetical protein
MKYRIVIPCQVTQEHPVKIGVWNRAIEFSVLDADSPDDAVEQAQEALQEALEETNRDIYRKFHEGSGLQDRK